MYLSSTLMIHYHSLIEPVIARSLSDESILGVVAERRDCRAFGSQSNMPNMPIE